MSKEIKKSNSNILFFILVFLLLFYDSRPIGGCKHTMDECNDSLLFFILVFLKLFYC
jgi:hypothetical protein